MHKTRDLGLFRRWFLGMAVMLVVIVSARGQLVWWDGSTTLETAAPGKLLSDNEDYWGDVVLTGVTYRYEGPAPNRPADNRVDRNGRTGRVLIDGNPDKHIALSPADTPLTIVFDFQRSCTFIEWDICLPKPNALAVSLDIGTPGDDDQAIIWQNVFTRSLDDSAVSRFFRIPLDSRPSGRYVRVTVQGRGGTALTEMLAWGDAPSDDTVSEAFNPVIEPTYPVGVAFQTITGIDTSCMSDRESYDFVCALPPALRREPAVWSKVSTWDAISNRPIAPEPGVVNTDITLTAGRNETEHAALALRNTLVSAPRDVRVSLTDFRDAQGRVVESIEASLGIMGVIPSLNFGSTLVPILYPDNMPGDSLLRKYLFNADTVIDFPHVKLPPSGSAVLWLSVTTDHTPPGVYTASVSVQGGQAVPVTVEVLDVTLPGGPFALIGTYSSNVTGMFPFVYADRQSRDIDRALDCGVSEWPIGERTDPNHVRMLQSKAAEHGMKLMFKFSYAVPSIFVHNTYRHIWKQSADIDAEHRKKLAEHVRHIVKVTQAMGLDYDQWYGALGDEPGEATCRVYSELCRLVKQVDPEVNLYVNPCFWSGWDRGGTLPDPNVTGALGIDDWYRRYVDVSMPLFLLLNDHPQSMAMFSSPRNINSYYYVSTHLCRSERRAEVTLARRMAWDSFSLGFNGWSFYSYYSPRASAWNHFDRNPRGEGLQEPSDYQMNYPGPRGIIATRHSEALRQGWEDWRLLNLLKSQGKQFVVDDLLRDYHRGVSTEVLHDQAVRAAAQAIMQ